MVIRTLKFHLGDLERLGVSTLCLFGSVARDTATATSDIDLLVEYAEPLTFDRYMDVKFYLEDLLHRRVDLVPRASLKPRLRPRIEKELIRVA